MRSRESVLEMPRNTLSPPVCAPIRGDGSEPPESSRPGEGGQHPSPLRCPRCPASAPGTQRPISPQAKPPPNETERKHCTHCDRSAHSVHTGAPGLILLARGVMPPLVMPPYSCSPVSRAAKAIVACRAVRRRHHTPPARPAVGMRAPLALLFLWRCVLTWYVLARSPPPDSSPTF